MFELLSPVTISSFWFLPSVNIYLIDAGLFVFSFELSSHNLFTFTLIVSAGTLNELVTLNPAL